VNILRVCALQNFFFHKLPQGFPWEISHFVTVVSFGVDEGDVYEALPENSVSRHKIFPAVRRSFLAASCLVVSEILILAKHVATVSAVLIEARARMLPEMESFWEQRFLFEFPYSHIDSLVKACRHYWP
jgi:hypothetical protein